MAVGLSDGKKAEPLMKSLMGCLSLSLVALAGCKKDPPPTPEPQKDPVVVASASASAKVAVPLPEENAPKEIPTLVPENAVIDGTKVDGVYLLDDGTLAVHQKLRIGHVANDKIDWLEKQAPEGSVTLGGTRITWVGGRWPDALDVTYSNREARDPQPTFLPLTGKGTSITYDYGGGVARLIGVARVGESTLVAGVDSRGVQFATVRGPGVIRARKTAVDVGCKGDEVPPYVDETKHAAVIPRGFGATSAGTVISVGVLCEQRNVTLEVWAKDKMLSTLIDLGDKHKGYDVYGAEILAGEGDEAWIRATSKAVVRYIDGRVETLPEIADGTERLFMSPNKKLYAANPWGIHRWDKDHWTQVARFGWEQKTYGLIADDKEQFWQTFWGGFVYRPGKATIMTDDCSTPFVFLYDVPLINEASYTFPTTRKALASFADVNDLTLVDFTQLQGERRLGVMVKTKAQGEALMEHVKKTMPKEKPRFLCYEPQKPRKIEIEGK